MLWATRPVAMDKEAPGWIGLSRLEVYSAQCWKTATNSELASLLVTAPRRVG